MNQTRENPLALFPLLSFLIVFVGAGIIYDDFYKISILIPAGVATILSLLINRNSSILEKSKQFVKGAFERNIITMITIFLLAGAFSAVANQIGAVEQTVNLALAYLPQSLILIGIFLIGSFVSLAMGTSVGTISALAPIAVGISAETELSAALTVAVVVSGAMFGDNLSIISDTTIAAVRTQMTKMKDKFKTNFFIVLPAAMITMIILAFLTPDQATGVSVDSVQWIRVLPYIGVLVAALLGLHVFLVLGGGILFAGLIGIWDGSLTLPGFFDSVVTGAWGMHNLILLTILLGGIVALMNYNGGIQYILNKLTNKVQTKKGAEYSLAGLVSTTNLATANNTIAILTTGPLAKTISDQYGIDSRKSASILDIFSCTIQGIIPYGAQILTAASLAEVAPTDLIPFAFYPIFIAIFGLIAISFNFPRFKTKQ
ncbi:Na+/H+ antiporter NhaC family protein [Pontibacillus marinus]|uniref:Sodium:proton antiporter n=1 Tax=Pontibacillus marinus BH030004 = DSM 16465 TaxID=1385511 RepID=A0A0A5FT68_9BACI|nr:Na+/H+ antiporter NhaC family protein [Pontibacillus marinus]KGX83961.1 sodium:proton antiporter [Pontibacillus marinus BH030004 = DSM 16465]